MNVQRVEFTPLFNWLCEKTRVPVYIEIVMLLWTLFHVLPRVQTWAR